MQSDAGGAPLAFEVTLLPRGYLLIGADDRLPPVLAFSADRNLRLDADPQNALRAMLSRDLDAARVGLRDLDARSRSARSTRFASSAPRHLAEWAALTVAAAATPQRVAQSDGPTNILVAPLIATTWSQWNHYNEAYPSDPQPGFGYDGKAPVGCVAVAAAQLGKFYAWPPRGRESYTDVDANTNNLISGSFSAGFDAPFGWAQMQNTYDPWSSEPTGAVVAVSDLLYRMGVAVDIDVGSFSAGGSSAYLSALGRSLSRYFMYDLGRFAQRDTDEALFDSQLRTDLLAGRPVPAGIPGHVILVDGLSDEAGGSYFHVNYGWGGYNDGWYRLSDIGGSSLTEAVFGVQPAFVPVPAGGAAATNSSGTFALQWSLPESRMPDTPRYRVREAGFVPADFVDEANTLAQWHNFSGTWFVDTMPGGAGTCFRKTGEIGRFELVSREVFRLCPGSRLSFRYRACLLDDHFRVRFSADRGNTWSTLRDYTNTGWNSLWHNEDVDLSAYAGCDIMLSFEYAFPSGYYYGQNGSVWIDRITLTGGERLDWTTIADNVAETVYVVSNRVDGAYFFSVEAYDGAAWSEPSEPIAIVVALDPALDVDQDGMPNGWETAYFGSATGGVAGADADADGMSNWAEYQAGTNPTNATDCLAIAADASESHGPTIRWPSVAGVTYDVLRAETLAVAGFIPVVSNLAATPPQNRYTDTNAAPLPTVFYRIRIATTR